MKTKLLLSLCIIWIIAAQSCFTMRMSDKDARTLFAQQHLSVDFLNVMVNNTNLHYARIGNPNFPTLFFIHGSPGSWDAFKQFMMDSDLLRSFRIISIDRPGYGYSNFGEAENLETNAQLITAIIKQESNGKPFHLIGHSIGGPVVVKLAQMMPNAFASLTILAGSISPTDEPKEQWRYLLQYTPLKYMLPVVMRTSNEEILRFKKELYLLDTGYAVLNMPVMFIQGDADPFVSIRNTYYGMKKLSFNPAAQKIVIPGANHFIPWEHFDIIKKHLLTLTQIK